MLTAALICAAGYCQDIIITKESEKIEATVLEVNIDDIKYRRADNPDGPAYTMKKADIASIIYGNGSVEVFDNAQAAEATVQPSVTAGYGKIAKDGGYVLPQWPDNKRNPSEENDGRRVARGV